MYIYTHRSGHLDGVLQRQCRWLRGESRKNNHRVAAVVADHFGRFVYLRRRIGYTHRLDSRRWQNNLQMEQQRNDTFHHGVAGNNNVLFGGRNPQWLHGHCQSGSSGEYKTIYFVHRRNFGLQRQHRKYHGQRYRRQRFVHVCVERPREHHKCHAESYAVRHSHLYRYGYRRRYQMYKQCIGYHQRNRIDSTDHHRPDAGVQGRIVYVGCFDRLRFLSVGRRSRLHHQNHD